MFTPEQAKRLACEVLAPPHGSTLDAEHTDPARSPALQHSRLPERIGGCRIVRLIASGGMGAVYEAMQDNPHRTVAVKIARPATITAGVGAAHWSRTASHRFRYESQILGQLQHPNIAQIYQAGVHDDGEGGIPYFVMEFVPDALPITDFARQHQLNIRPKLELFLQACAAVQHGHTRGFIHRDLKPANMLVGVTILGAIPPSLEGGGQGVCETHADPEAPVGQSIAPQSSGLKPQDSRLSVKIIDFGVARATNADISLATMHTATGQIVGTLQYMSPEQCEGRADNMDTRSDVYALGVVLYELLCERLPYSLQGATLTEAARIVGQTEPPQPRSLDRTLPRDLDTIALKALQKDRARRYQSVGEFADDLRRWLCGEPILARKPTQWQRTMRLVGRHPRLSTIVACAAIFVLTLTSAIVTTWWLNSRPAYFDMEDNRSSALLRTASGTVLAIAGDGTYQSVAFACVLKSADGQRLAAVAARGGDLNTDGELWVFALDVLSEPLHVPPPLESPAGTAANGDRYDVSDVVVADVFPGNPGMELIACYINSCCEPSAIRVYDFNLQCLAEYWHYGPVRSMYWIEADRMLVCQADMCGTGADQTTLIGKRPYPLAVFSLRPQSSEVRTWLDDGNHPGAHAHITWYGVLRPAASWAFDPDLRRPGPRKHVAHCVTLVLDAFEMGAADLIISAEGQVVTSSPSGDYAKNAASGQVPRLDDFTLELPPPFVRNPRESD